MTLSNEERSAFLNRLGAVEEARLISSEIEGDEVEDPEREWTDAEIQMAIELGF